MVITYCGPAYTPPFECFFFRVSVFKVVLILNLPDSWRTFEVPGILGAVLVPDRFFKNVMFVSDPDL